MTPSENIVKIPFCNELININDITWIDRTIAILAILAICDILGIIINKILLPVISKLITKSENKWDDHIFNDNILEWIKYLIFSIICSILCPIAALGSDYALYLINSACRLAITITATTILFKTINSLQEYFKSTDTKITKFKGVFTVTEIIVVLVGVLLGISIVFNIKPVTILTGIGASAAILSLVFKDTILSLVAGFQLNYYKSLLPGDWIVMESHNINGEVIETNLNIVRILNWDNSIATIPTHLFLQESFQNYRQMRNEKSRRICEKLYIDINSVKLAQGEALKQYEKAVPNKQTDGKQVTNLHFYRYFLENNFQPIERADDGDHKAFTQLMVKTLEPTPQGLPIEIYFFIAETDWVKYEHYKAEILEFAIASLPTFDLKPFQSPTGSDLQRIL